MCRRCRPPRAMPSLALSSPCGAIIVGMQVIGTRRLRGKGRESLALSILPTFNVSFAVWPLGRRSPKAHYSTLHGAMAMKRYIIEREIPGIGGMTSQQLEQAAIKSNAALAKLQGRAQWVHSYVAGNKTFCVYLAEDETAVREHAQVSGFPANTITEIRSIIDPVTAG